MTTQIRTNPCRASSGRPLAPTHGDARHPAVAHRATPEWAGAAAGGWRWLGLLCLLTAPTLAACGSDPDGGAADTQQAVGWTRADAPLERKVQDLVDRLAPQTEGGNRELDAWIEQVRATLESMQHVDPDVGRAVLVLLDERDDFDPGLRSRLLDAAARSMATDEQARAELATFLTTRIETYGQSMGERNTACELLGTHCPEVAVAVLGPLLLPDQRTSTLPDREFMLRGYLEGAERTGVDPHDLLCEIALERRVDHFTRKLALRALAEDPTPRAISVFEAVMTESSGDALLRSAAVSCFMESVSTERAIERLTEIHDREADLNMQILLQNALASLRGER